jgi:hypothetical protein
MKKVLYLFAAIVMAGALSGCYAAPNAPGVTPYGTAMPNAPGAAPYATAAPNAPGGAYSNGGVRPGAVGTYGSVSNTAGSKNIQNPTSRMNALMNERGYIFINPGDKAAFPGAR